MCVAVKCALEDTVDMSTEAGDCMACTCSAQRSHMDHIVSQFPHDGYPHGSSRVNERWQHLRARSLAALCFLPRLRILSDGSEVSVKLGPISDMIHICLTSA